MKIRNGFVSNSSSCSFTIDKWNLSPNQIEMIFNHVKFGEAMGMDNYEEVWSIEETETSLHFFTWMDNFDMIEFLKRIGVNENYVLDYDKG